QGMDLRQTDLGALNTFVAFDYKVDSEKLDWNNTLKGSLGIRLRMRASEHMSINIGVKLTREHRFVADNTWSDVVYFVNWGADWGSSF
ncbi:MAG: hypothetical protein LJE83_08895, partial [Gammaproteobacteria bacterium]|nr:hypothetical protein [Gammaproteobacteria bacterium]